MLDWLEILENFFMLSGCEELRTSFKSIYCAYFDILAYKIFNKNSICVLKHSVELKK